MREEFDSTGPFLLVNQNSVGGMGEGAEDGEIQEIAFSGEDDGLMDEPFLTCGFACRRGSR